jgi:4'-phosphopantetheinyl transferase EntD
MNSGSPATPDLHRAATTIVRLLPASVSAVEAFDDSVPSPLFPEEQAQIANAVAKRANEFATGRRCAREALEALGFPAGPLLTGAKREPLWPAGVVGSITHCTGYRAAVVALGSDLASVGVDAEPHEPLPDGVLAAIALPQEIDRLAVLRRADPATHWDRLLFSAKESVYKAWFPLTGRWLDFHEADIVIEPAGRFTATLLVPGPTVGGAALQTFTGRFSATGALVLTAIAIPAGSA